MPEKKTIERAKRAKREGKAPTTQAGEFVREEIHHVREGEHGARSPEQAIAIGLSKARRAGVDLPVPKDAPPELKRRAARDRRKGRAAPAARKPAPQRSRATERALRREGHEAASPEALAEHARTVARQRTPTERSAAAEKAVRTKGPAKRKSAAKKAASTRRRHATS